MPRLPRKRTGTAPADIEWNACVDYLAALTPIQTPSSLGTFGPRGSIRDSSGGGGGASSNRLFHLKSVGGSVGDVGDYLVCRSWDGTTEGPTDVYVAKPDRLRESIVGEVKFGITYNYTYADTSGDTTNSAGHSNNRTRTSTNTSDSSTENELVLPIWEADPTGTSGEMIEAIPVEYTGVTGGDSKPVKLLMVETHRQWAKIDADNPNVVFLGSFATAPTSPIINNAYYDTVLKKSFIWTGVWSEIAQDGTNGTSGTSGTNGTNGTNGTSGTTGATGAAGTSGTSGASGTSGTSTATSGTSGVNGTSGTSGVNGTSGTSGSGGAAGTSGTSGNSGTSGTSGAGGSNGTSGTSGVSPTVTDQFLGADFSTTLATAVATNLTFAVNTSDLYIIDAQLTCTTGSSGGIKYQISAPSASVIEGWIYSTDSSGTLTATRLTSVNALTAAIHGANNASGADHFFFTVNCGTSGNITVAAASAVAGNTSKIFKGSSLIARKATSV